MWAIEHDDIAPDVILAGKGLASGLPLAALIARDELMRMGPGKHGSTFGGNPVACVAAVATLDLVESSLSDNAARVGAHLMGRLRTLRASHTEIVDVRGRG